MSTSFLSFRSYNCFIFPAAHSQVGNAVPPPLSRAIGQEIKKCVMQRMKEEQAAGSYSFLSELDLIYVVYI